MLSFSRRKQSDLFYFHCTEKLHQNSSLFHYLLSPSSASLLDTGNRKQNKRSTFSHFVLPQPLWLLQPANMLSKMEGLSPLLRATLECRAPLQSEGQAGTQLLNSTLQIVSPAYFQLTLSPEVSRRPLVWKKTAKVILFTVPKLQDWDLRSLLFLLYILNTKVSFKTYQILTSTIHPLSDHHIIVTLWEFQCQIKTWAYLWLCEDLQLR